MSQPLAIYASVPALTGADWLAEPPVSAPVTVAAPFPYWPSLDWSDGNIAPSSGYGETPQYLWSIPNPDPNDNAPKTFTRRLTASAATGSPTIQKFPVGGAIGHRFRLIFSIAADDEYTFQLLVNEQPLPREVPASGFNFQTPMPLPWTNVKTYSFGLGVVPITFSDGDRLSIKTTVTNLPQAQGVNNLAMVTWVLQLFSCNA